MQLLGWFSSPRNGDWRSPVPELKQADYIGCRKGVMMYRAKADRFRQRVGWLATTAEEAALHPPRMRSWAFWCLSFTLFRASLSGWSLERGKWGGGEWGLGFSGSCMGELEVPTKQEPISMATFIVVL